MTDSHIGIHLYDRGWRQGSVFSASKTFATALIVDPSSETVGWTASHSQLKGKDLLIVASQTCDIARKPETEPFVEAVRGFWTSNAKIMHSASHNSVKQFLMRTELRDGTPHGLIAEATKRVFLEKESLRRIVPETGFQPDDTMALPRFKRWLAARYDRQVVPDELVFAVQQPIADAYQQLNDDHQICQLLGRVREIMFNVTSEDEPYSVEIWFMRYEDVTDPNVDIDEEAAAEIADWINTVLGNHGKAFVDHWEILDTASITARDFLLSYRLPLDPFSISALLPE